VTVRDDKAYLEGFEDGCATMSDAVAALRRDLIQWKFISVMLGTCIGVVTYIMIGRVLWRLSLNYSKGLSS
jgi:hypothetical protein